MHAQLRLKKKQQNSDSKGRKMKQDGLFKILLPSCDITLDLPPSYACFYFPSPFFFSWQWSIVTATCFSWWPKGGKVTTEAGEQKTEAWLSDFLYQAQNTKFKLMDIRAMFKTFLFLVIFLPLSWSFLCPLYDKQLLIRYSIVKDIL